MDLRVSRANKFVAEKYLLNFLCVRCSESLSLENGNFVDENSCCAAENCFTMLQTLGNRRTFLENFTALRKKRAGKFCCQTRRHSLNTFFHEFRKGL